MTIAAKLADFLDARRSGRRLAKAVLVEDNEGYVLAVLPSTHHVALSDLGEALQRRPLRLAREDELASLFTDCELDAQPEVYFEAGDHEHMVHMTRAEFSQATHEVRRAHFSRIDCGLSRRVGGDT
jgi:Ala-tRNA(Pro) deacylase